MTTACTHCRILIADDREAVELVRRDPPDVILLDAMLPGLDGFATAARIGRLGVPTRVLMVSRHASPEYAGRAFAAGVSGYINEDSGPDELSTALIALCAGQRYLCRTIDAGLVRGHERQTRNGAEGLHALTPRQRQVLKLIAEGQGTRRIAEHLALGVKTVETHRAELMHRLCIYDVAGLVRFAIRNGLLPP